MEKKKEIIYYFEEILENIKQMENNSFYTDKEMLKKIKIVIQKWYGKYAKTELLKNIEIEELKDLDFTISDCFNVYFSTESLEDNYSERLLYNFSILKHYWKDEMLLK